MNYSYNYITLIFWESVRSMASQSILILIPSVGGNPYSSAVQYDSSKTIVSSSHNCRSEIKSYQLIKIQQKRKKKKSCLKLAENPEYKITL